VDIGESWGNPYGREIFTQFFDACVSDFGLGGKVALWAQSRGGLMHYNWAAEHPERVKCIGGIYPVLTARGSRLLPRIAEAYGMPEPAFMKIVDQNDPIERLAPIAEKRIPVFNVHGDSDDVVPVEANSAELVRRYEALGGAAKVTVVPGRGHEEVKEFFECRDLVDFLVSNA
jgi:pimeloyl-ACP methyl ester carboxylesterase